MPTTKFKRWENRPAMPKDVPLIERLRSVHVLTSYSVRAIELYLYDNDLEEAPMIDLIKNVPCIGEFDSPKCHLQNLMTAGYLYITRRDPGTWGRRYLTISDRGYQVLADIDQLQQQSAEAYAAEIQGG